jgi:hypothetical protein
MNSESLRIGFPVILLIGLLSLAINRISWVASVFDAIESFGCRLARKKLLAIPLTAASALMLRLILLPVVPVPTPEMHDEFSYLLQADTFAHGRLTNSPHPMWIYFDTMHVLQHPTYMSKYPPGQGMALALGQVLGHPWIGALLSVATMIAALVWALQGWLPSPWALLGGFLALFRLGLFGYWINSYWGGAVAAVGGALVIGALPRIVRKWRAQEAVILGLGVSILANSRPFEGLVFSLPVLVVLLISLFRRESPSWRKTIPHVVVPFCAVLLICGLFMAYYDWRGTGNALLLPYSVFDHLYEASTPALLWQKAAPVIHYTNPQFDTFYNGWNLDSWREGRADSFAHAVRLFVWDVKRYFHFFLWPELAIPAFAAFWYLRDRRIRFLIVQMLICFGGFLLVAWFQPHYTAPLVATLFILVSQGLRHVRRLKYHNQAIGIALSRAVVLSVVICAPFHTLGYQEEDFSNRVRVATQLSDTPGRHLVIVHYSAKHDALAEWVYNRADIDDAKIVWARDIPGIDLDPLLRYFRGRRVWIVEPDSPAPTLLPYPTHPSP